MSLVQILSPARSSQTPDTPFEFALVSGLSTQTLGHTRVAHNLLLVAIQSHLNIEISGQGSLSQNHGEAISRAQQAYCFVQAVVELIQQLPLSGRPDDRI